VSSGRNRRARIEVTSICSGAAVAAKGAPEEAAICNRRDAGRDLDARRAGARHVRAATSMRRAGVKRRCALGYRGGGLGVKGRVHTGAEGAAWFAGRGPQSRAVVRCAGGACPNRYI